MTNLFEFMAAQTTSAGGGGSRSPRTGERGKKARLILLAINLLCLKRGWRGQEMPARISVPDLTRNYLDDRLAATQEAARKMAQRDLEAIRSVFGLTGDGRSGFSLAMDFEPPHAFRKMFAYWLEHLQRDSSPHDDTLKMMLEGLIRAIDSPYTSDPICIPELARELQQLYGKKNLREPRRALETLFDDRAMAAYLPMEPLNADDPDTLKVDIKAEPLLLRRRDRSEVGDNVDGTHVLARPGLIRQQARMIFMEQPRDLAAKLERLARAVEQMEVWKDANGRTAVPYRLNLETAKDDRFTLVVYWMDDECYEDVPVQSIVRWPDSAPAYIPEDVTEELWKQWKSLSSWQV